MLIGKLGASVMGNILTGKRLIRADEGAIATNQGREANIPRQGTIKAGQEF